VIESIKYNYILSPQFSVVQLAIKFANCVFPDFSLSLVNQEKLKYNDIFLKEKVAFGEGL